jgi:L-methionine (R)-S-oxide reductase
MDFWEQLTRECASLTSTEPDDIANMANVSSALFHALNAARQNSINWCGFYRNLDDSCLVLGPFQGRVACIRIPFGKGVCGACALSGEAQVVPDVHKFPGHIACDSASQSELVVPIRRDGKLLGVLDIDSR